MRAWMALIAAVGGLTATAVQAESSRSWMQEPQIRAELTNLKIAGLYPSNIAWSEQIKADGTTDYEEANERRPGTWSIAGELFWGQDRLDFVQRRLAQAPAVKSAQ